MTAAGPGCCLAIRQSRLAPAVEPPRKRPQASMRELRGSQLLLEGIEVAVHLAAGALDLVPDLPRVCARPVTSSSR